MTGVVNVSGGCAAVGLVGGPDMPSAASGWLAFIFSLTESFTQWAVAPPTSLAVISRIHLNMIPHQQLGPPRRLLILTTRSTTWLAAYFLNQERLTSIASAARQPGRQRQRLACFAITQSPTPSSTLGAGDNWPGDVSGTILPGGFAVMNNKLYIVGGFDINVASTNQIWQFDPTAPSAPSGYKE